MYTSISNGIRAGTINISEDYFLRCFYPYARGDPNNVEKGFLRSCLLVKVFSDLLASPSTTKAPAQTFSSIFISPTSSELFIDKDENGAARKKPRLASNPRKKATKSNVASLLGMDGRVTPRSIAYAAVLVRPLLIP